MKRRIKLLICALVASIGVTAVGSFEPASAMPTSCYQVENSISNLSSQIDHFDWSLVELQDYSQQSGTGAGALFDVYYTNPWTDQWVEGSGWTVTQFVSEQLRIQHAINQYTIQLTDAYS